jgi:hypothetical protein
LPLVPNPCNLYFLGFLINFKNKSSIPGFFLGKVPLADSARMSLLGELYLLILQKLQLI